ncbi:MAG: hypothetical protein ACREF9_13515, partial [Opitutaceae bacterium]
RIEHSSKVEAFHFLGARRLMPFTIYHLSLVFRMPIVFCLGVPGAANESLLHASPVFEPDGASREANLERARSHFQAFLGQLESLLRANPCLWFNVMPISAVPIVAVTPAARAPARRTPAACDPRRSHDWANPSSWHDVEQHGAVEALVSRKVSKNRIRRAASQRELFGPPVVTRLPRREFDRIRRLRPSSESFFNPLFAAEK